MPFSEGVRQFTADFVSKNEEQQIVTAPVLIPDKPDRHGDVIPADNIEQVAENFLEEYQNIDVMHTLENVAKPVESYVAPTDLTFQMGGESKEVPAGSWMLSVKVTDPEVWRAVKRGELTGFSIYGAADPANTGGGSGSQPNLWLDRVTHVSLVDEPAVGDSEFVVAKRKTENENMEGKSELEQLIQEVLADNQEGDLEEVSAELATTLADVTGSRAGAPEEGEDPGAEGEAPESESVSKSVHPLIKDVRATVDRSQEHSGTSASPAPSEEHVEKRRQEPFRMDLKKALEEEEETEPETAMGMIRKHLEEEGDLPEHIEKQFNAIEQSMKNSGERQGHAPDTSPEGGSYATGSGSGPAVMDLTAAIENEGGN